jgi:hypothetical protein
MNKADMLRNPGVEERAGTTSKEFWSNLEQSDKLGKVGSHSKSAVSEGAGQSRL